MGDSGVIVYVGSSLSEAVAEKKRLVDAREYLLRHKPDLTFPRTKSRVRKLSVRGGYWNPRLLHSESYPHRFSYRHLYVLAILNPEPHWFR